MAINIEEEKIDDKVLNDESDEAIEANPELLILQSSATKP